MDAPVLLRKSDDPSLYRLPPQNVEAEESVLSAILLESDRDALFEVLETLKPESFYKTSHQRIYKAMIALFEKNEPVDAVTLSNKLKESGDLEDIGGGSYISWLLDSVPFAVNVPHYARIVHDKAALRTLIEKSNAITKRCYEDKGDVDGVIEFAEKAIFEIAEDKVKKAYSPISELLYKSLDDLGGRDNSMVTGVTTGYDRLDELTAGLQKTDMIILAARPSMGKTAFALNITSNAAEAGVPVALFSLEMSKEQLAMRMLSTEARIDSTKMRNGNISSDDWASINAAAGRLNESPIFIDDSPGLTAMEIHAKSRRLKMDHDIGLIVIDYVQLMRTKNSSEGREREISIISGSLKALAKELDVPVLALAQLNRKLEERADKRPQLSDLRESGSLEQDADLVMFIYRDEVYNKDENNPNAGTAEIIIAKHRNGPTGYAPLAFINKYTRFENLSSEY